MFPDYSTVTVEMISKYSYPRWMNSGMVWRGEYLMQNTLEHPKGDVEFSLSEVMEASSPQECFLSPMEIISLLNRAWERGQMMDPILEKAMVFQLHFLSSTQELIESLQPDLKQKVIEVMEKHIPSTVGEVQTLFVRRMMASEYEKLQGFPENWTQID
jgi:hypothetical protein